VDQYRPKDDTAYLRLAGVREREGNLARAIGAYKEALRFRTPEAAPLEYAMTQYNLGNAYRALDNQAASARYRAAIVAAGTAGDRATEAKASWNLGLLLEESEPTQAAELMQVCVDYELETGDPDAKDDAERVRQLQERAGADLPQA